MARTAKDVITLAALLELGPSRDIEGLVLAAAHGEERAWKELWTVLEPRVHSIVRRQRLFAVRVENRSDDLRDVFVAFMGRLHANHFSRLRRYLSQRSAQPSLTFLAWASVVAKRVAIDCLRAHPDYVDTRRSAARGPGVWIRAERLAPDRRISGGGPTLSGIAAREIMRYAETALPALQRAALELWLGHRSDGEIARALQLGHPADAQRLVHAALERLRRHYRAPACNASA
jgi:DNA-directed RNA polymerase specialized sigma24 family protein